MEKIRFNRYDSKYKAFAEDMLQQIISKGFRVEEIRFILELASDSLEAKINELELQSLLGTWT